MAFAVTRRDWFRVRVLLHVQTIDQIAAGYFKGMTTGPELAAAMREKGEHERRVRAIAREKRREERPPSKKRVTIQYVPNHVLEDRQRRLNAPETLNSKYLGDPVVPRWMSNANNSVEHPRYVGMISRY